ncbi:DUF3556 domain-containing protein [Nocardia sp. BMG111209]|uniref:DUF3556 domain-containing protein n=1 Tax=Nocardia sp. BMG111209 TaxID=1160137 RepID=UPI0004756D08|nr:DUF3556 domain-containing protein [Nocardia sp. BMG111209]
MGFLAPDLPDIDETRWQSLTRSERMRIMSVHWAEYGFGTPWGVLPLYLLKCVVYVAGAAAVIGLTAGFGGIGHLTEWWTQPVAYQKLIVWTLLWELVGLGCGSGPLTMRFLPPIGGILYFLRPGTVRLPPWPRRVPFTRGDRRTAADMALYAVVLVSAIWTLMGRATAAGVLDARTVIPLLVALALLGLRDKTVFLAARAEHYGLAVLVFFFSPTEQIIGWKLIMLALWWGAATSKLNHHFPFVVSVMMSNSPVMRLRWLKRKMYRDFPRDLRASRIPFGLAHFGTVVEYTIPACLVFFCHGGTFTVIAVGAMMVFHLHILSTMPVGVPLEWNVFFVISIPWLFGHYADVDVLDLRSPVLGIVLLLALLVVPAVGNLKPEWISFLPSMRYYAGNWATSVWLFRGNAEERIEAALTASSGSATTQLTALYGAHEMDMIIAKGMAWRAMHPHGRALNTLIERAVDNLDDYAVRDGETVAGHAVGWNFGEGHLHNEQLLAALQRRCAFEPGDVRVVILEAQSIHRQRQHYRIVDAATGLVEEGFVRVADMIARQPWPDPADPVPVQPLERVAAQ